MTLETVIATEKIKCPECEFVQLANITQNGPQPFATYLHECENCKHIIMESEWDTVIN
jgi:hypothetical protein